MKSGGCPRFDAEDAADVEHDHHCSDYQHPDQNTEGRNFRALGFAGSFGWPGKLLSQFESVAGKIVRLSAEFVSGQMIAFVVGDGRGGVGMGRKAVELCGPVVRAG